MALQGTPRHVSAIPDSAVVRSARAIVTDPKVGYASAEIRMTAWAILKSARGQTINQTRLNGMPIEGLRP